eukprot:scaffold616_cov306-Pavlova_lutheri.AAC.33
MPLRHQGSRLRGRHPHAGEHPSTRVPWSSSFLLSWIRSPSVPASPSLCPCFSFLLSRIRSPSVPASPSFCPGFGLLLSLPLLPSVPASPSFCPGHPSGSFPPYKTGPPSLPEGDVPSDSIRRGTDRTGKTDRLSRGGLRRMGTDTHHPRVGRGGTPGTRVARKMEPGRTQADGRAQGTSVGLSSGTQAMQVGTQGEDVWKDGGNTRTEHAPPPYVSSCRVARHAPSDASVDVVHRFGRVLPILASSTLSHLRSLVRLQSDRVGSPGVGVRLFPRSVRRFEPWSRGPRIFLHVSEARPGVVGGVDPVPNPIEPRGRGGWLGAPPPPQHRSGLSLSLSTGSGGGVPIGERGGNPSTDIPRRGTPPVSPPRPLRSSDPPTISGSFVPLPSRILRLHPYLSSAVCVDSTFGWRREIHAPSDGPYLGLRKGEGNFARLHRVMDARMMPRPADIWR